MTNKQFLFVVIPVVIFLLSIGYCVPERTKPEDETQQIKRRYAENIQQLDSSLAVLKMAITTHAPIQQIHESFYHARLQYKQVEFLVEYYNPYTAKSMNGPAIDEVEEDDPTQTIIRPTGFQVVEELLFPALDSYNQKEALKEIAVLQSCINRLRLVAKTTQLTHGHVFDAMRQEIFRVTTLGITGFDSPVAFHSMPEAAAALSALKETFMLYQPQLASKSPGLSAQVHEKFDASIHYLKSNPDFNIFDRATFITTYANTLSIVLADAQQTLKITTPAILRALSPWAKTLFDKNAFNANYYAPDQYSNLTPAQAQLGKMLFFDPLLSGNNSRSCASCHNPQKAFTDGQAKSVAFDFKGQVNRNAPTIINAGLQRSLFYDMRVAFLEDQANQVLSNEKEMHGSFQKAALLLAQSPQYVALFQKAFPKQTDTIISAQEVKAAITSYIRSLTGMNSRFDQYMRGAQKQLTHTEQKGLNLFMGKAKCATCHFLPLFNGTIPPNFDNTEAEIIGVPASKDTLQPTLDTDLGKYALYKKDLHKYAFKTPTLRNVALTAPYMHNGVYGTLEEVVDFYNNGGGIGLGIDLPTQTLPADRLNLEAHEKEALVAFMQALTDTTGLTSVPEMLPSFPKQVVLNNRKIGGKY